MTTAPLRVVVIDDDARVRDDFRTILELEPDLVVVGAAADGGSGVDLCRRLRPQVAVVDVRMPGLDGIAVTRALADDSPEPTRVLVVTTFDLDEYVLASVRAGASGFLLKDQAADVLADAVRTVARGDGIVSPRATARLLREVNRRPAPPPASPLSDRETTIARHIAAGLTNRDIARVESISPLTVKSHVSSILTKLAVANRIHIALWAHEQGLVSDER